MIQDTDEFLISNNNQAYKVTALRLAGTGAAVAGDMIITRLEFPSFTVVQYKIPYADLATKLDNNDLMLVSRGGQSYNTRGEEYKLYVNTTLVDAGQSVINFTKGTAVPFAHQGHFPLYVTPEQARQASPIGKDEFYDLSGGRFYMPEGISNTMRFIGNFTGITNYERYYK